MLDLSSDVEANLQTSATGAHARATNDICVPWTTTQNAESVVVNFHDSVGPGVILNNATTATGLSFTATSIDFDAGGDGTARVTAVAVADDDNVTTIMDRAVEVN